MLAKMFLGVESPFTMSIESSLNTTFLMSALGVTYLCCDPLIKTIYALRCFYGEARTTGEDLLVSLRSFRAPAAALALALLAWMAPLSAADAPNTGTPPKTERGAALDQSIESVLRQPEYTWRSPRPKREEKPKEEAAFWERFRESFRKMMRSFSDWLDKLFRSTPRPPTAARGFSFTTENLVYVLIAVVVLIIGVLFYILWRTRSRRLAVETEATPTAPVPDLTAEDVAGDELPVDGWTALALELLERGELRLAMRAFYLSSLAHLAARNLVTIARFKSNRDYERELRRRSHALPELSQTFAENVSVFDRVWYGLHEINTDLLQQFRSNVERIRAT
jgi:hypothetical protein